MSAIDPSGGERPGQLSIAVMVSGEGRGTNLAALLSACESGAIYGRIVVVIGTRADAPALLRAKTAGVATAVVSPRSYEGDDEAYGSTLLRHLDRHRAALICLAGYMRKLPLKVLERYNGRVMNVHAALLPSFGGKGMYGERVHQAVLDAGVKVTGCTVHFVDEEYDSGPIIVQKPVCVDEEDTAESLGARVLDAEHSAYVEAVQLFAQHRLCIQDHRVRVHAVEK